MNRLIVVLVLLPTAIGSIFAGGCSTVVRRETSTVLSDRVSGYANSTNAPQPVVALWDNGNQRNEMPPSILFAAWADGRVVRRLKGRLYLGHVPEDSVTQLVNHMIVAGVNGAPMSRAIVNPARPTELLCVDLGPQQVALTNDVNVNWQEVQELPLTGNPSRTQMQVFEQIWSRAMEVIDEVWPEKLEQVVFVSGLDYPQAKVEANESALPAEPSEPSVQPMPEVPQVPAIGAAPPQQQQASQPAPSSPIQPAPSAPEPNAPASESNPQPTAQPPAPQQSPPNAPAAPAAPSIESTVPQR